MKTVTALSLCLLWGCATHKMPLSYQVEQVKKKVDKPVCERVVTAEVVALDQVYYYNRFGSFNPAGIMYALRRDVVIDRDSLDEIIASLSEKIDRLEKEIARTTGPDKDTLQADLGLLQTDLPRLKKLRGELPEDRLSGNERPKAQKASSDDKAQKKTKKKEPEIVNGNLDAEKEAEKESEINIPSKEEGVDRYLAGHIKLRSDKRPRPLVLRANEGDCLLVTFTNLLSPELDGQEVALDPEKRLTHPEKKVLAVSDSDEPTTRHASMHVNGLSLVDSIDSQGANVGRNGWHRKNQHGDLVATDGKCSANRQDFGKDLCALAAPGETRTYTWYAKKEGAYLFYSMGAPAGGEGDGGQIGLGLFGSVNVQPNRAEWYRSQVTAQELTAATIKSTKYGQPEIDYRASFKDGPRKDDPILNMLKCQESQGQGQERCEIIYSDLNAVIDIKKEDGCEQMGEGNACGRPYREFTTIFHDEITAVQAFDEIREESSPLSSLRDGMGINYGASGLGAMVVANRKKLGPSRDCVECKLEEFFLTSWVHGDPAMVVGYKKNDSDQLVPILDRQGKPAYDAEGRPLYQKEAKYPDDPSNVHHSYLGDPVRFRNMHAGPKETHVFHLHAHQWVEDKHDPLSHYLDSQTISPGSVFSYEIHYGGSGNRNLGPGDSIFHCHLYPHFAQGMWELWRTHDVFENGTLGLFDATKPVSGKNHPGMRNLPDAEIAEGTPNPAIVPLPRTPLPPMPTKDFDGYPFYIAGVKGHRPPQPPLDLEGKDDAGTLQRHVILGGTVRDARDAHGPEEMKKAPLLNKDLYDRGRKESANIAFRVSSQNRDEGLIALARELKTAKVEPLSNTGQPSERDAMWFHAGEATVNGASAVKPGNLGLPYTPYNWKAPGYRTCLPDGTCDGDPATHGARILFRVNGEGNQDEAKQEKALGKPGAPFSNPCPKQFVDEKGMVHDVKTREYRTVYIQMDMRVNKAGWHDPQARLPVLEEDLQATLDGTRPTEPLFFRANSGECIVFKATNLIPSNLNVDDFQVYSPTDTMGQHIHLVKFDVTSSDGSGNGWNYEDGTLAADEIRERILAHNATNPSKKLRPRTHRLFLHKGELGAIEDGAMAGDPRGQCSDITHKEADDHDLIGHPWCGAQTTIQRWWADPLLNGKPGDKGVKDRTLRTVFTHDHFGPSSHQHHGFYAALVIEPRNSKWFSLDGQAMGGTDAGGSPAPVNGRKDGGPTSYAANIIVRDQGKACLTVESDGLVCSDTLDNKTSIDTNRTGREFNLAFADFAIVYDKENQPINPPSQIEGGLRIPILPGRIPVPEGISTKDPGTQLINYRNEPIPLRIGEQDKNSNQFKQRLPAEDTVEEDKNSKKTKVISSPGNLAHVFASTVHEDQDQNWLNACRSQNEKERKPEQKCFFTESYDRGRIKGDPATPLLRAYEGDHVQIRLIQGAQEEQHVFTMHGSKWLAQPDSPNTGYVNAQQIGISEHFEFNDRVVEFMPFDQGNGNGLSGGGHRHKVVDHLYSSAAADNLWDGQWGLMRVYSRTEEAPALARLPGNTEKTHDVLASAFVQKHIDERFDSEELEVSDENPADTGLQEGQQALPSKDALEAFCRTNAQKTLSQTFEVQAWLAKDLLPDGKLVYNKHFGITDPNAILFVEAADVSKLKSGSKDPEPLILRARAGDCIHVTLTNKIDPVHHRDGPDDPEGKTWSYNMVPPIVPGFSFNQVRSSNHVGLHPQLVDYNLQTSDGAHVGLNDDSTVGPGDSKTYLWYAGDIATNKKGNRIVGTPYEFGAIALQDMGDVIKHASHGAIGALIVEPQCSRWDDAGSLMKATVEVTYWKPEPVQGRYGKRWKKQVCPLDETWLAKAKGFMPYGMLAYYKEPAEDSGTLYRFKEMVLLYQDNLSLQQYGQPLPNLRNGDDSEDSGQKAFNYRTEPLWARLGASAADEPDTMSEFDWSNVLSSTVSHFRCDADFSSKKYCDPETPLFKAKAGEPVRFRVVHPGGHPRQHGFTVFGHDWSMSPWIDDSKTMGWNQFSRARVGSTSGIGPGRDLNIMTSAGGDCAVPGDYLYRTQEGFMFGGGLWGILRVEENPGLAWYQPSWGWAGRIFGYEVNADVCRVNLSTADTAPRK